MICCKEEMRKYIGAVRVCKKCGTLKFDKNLERENRRKELEDARQLKKELKKK